MLGISCNCHNLSLGEDSDEMSAAGQMETILGVRGLQQVGYICIYVLLTPLILCINVLGTTVTPLFVCLDATAPGTFFCIQYRSGQWPFSNIVNSQWWFNL